MRRQWAASEAISLGWGGVSLVSSATGLARNTIAVGLGELALGLLCAIIALIVLGVLGKVDAIRADDSEKGA